jgi:hypothetical protein
MNHYVCDDFCERIATSSDVCLMNVMGAQFGVFIQEIQGKWQLWGQGIDGHVVCSSFKETLDLARVLMDAICCDIYPDPCGRVFDWSKESLVLCQSYLGTLGSVQEATNDGYVDFYFSSWEKY